MVAYALLCLVLIVWAPSWGQGDFPCDWFGSFGFPSEDVGADTRLAYCVSSYSSWGASPLLRGATSENQITLRPPFFVFWYGNLDLKRQDELLVVNGQSLLPGQTYTRTRWVPALNPWFIKTARITVQNSGIITPSGSFPVLYVLGEATTIPYFNPTGLLLLIAGVWLIVCDILK